MKSNVPLKRILCAGVVITAFGNVAESQAPVSQAPVSQAPASLRTSARQPDLAHMKVSNDVDDFYFTTRVGSFKILPRGDTLPSGTLVLSFTGSVLVSELNGTIVPSGKIRREYYETKRNKQVWFGTGKLTIKGNFSGVQWFGRDLNAEFHGNGFIRLYGEFDKNLDTGTYWFDPANKKFWGTYGTGVPIPEQVVGGKPITREEFNKQKQEGQKKGKGGG